MAIPVGILISLSYLPTIFTIDMDYFLSSPKYRIQKSSCGRMHNIICQTKCGSLSSLCIKNECYCLSVTTSHDIGSSKPVIRSSENMGIGLDYVDLSRSDIVSPEDSAETISYTFRPALRHHIAHFCPSLDIARSCIKKCMAVGKPAFCGKDHVCYCGHKYANTEDDKENNLKETYSQFKDMYTKYFGTNTDSEND